MIMIIQKGGPRRNASLVGQNQGQRMWYAIKSNVPDYSMDKDKYQEESRQRKTIKYLRESCYHHIKCFATNPLATLIKK